MARIETRTLGLLSDILTVFLLSYLASHILYRVIGRTLKYGERKRVCVCVGGERERERERDSEGGHDHYVGH